MSTNWRALEIHSEDGDEPTTFGDRLAELRDQVSSGRVDAAFDEAIDLAFGLHTAGLDREVLELLDELESFVSESEVDRERWPWLANTRGMALSGLGRHDEAEAAYRQMQQLTEKLAAGEPADHLRSTALQNLGIVALESGDPKRGAELFREALPMKVELGHWESAVDVLNSLALAVLELGDLGEAERMLTSVEELSRMLKDPRRLGAAFGNRGILRTRRGDLAGAEADFRAALRYARKEGDPVREVLGVMNVGASLADQGRYGEALRWYRRGARWAAEAGAAVIELRLRRAVALTLLRLGRPAEALAAIELALDLAEAVGHQRYTAECRADRGALLVELGDDKRAREELEAARREFAALEDRGWEAQVVRNLAELALHTDALEEADEFWSAAIELLHAIPDDAADVARRAAEVWVERGDTRNAERWLQAELELAERFEEDAPLAWRNATAGALLNWRRPTEAGLRLLEQALARYEALPADGAQQSRVRIEVAVALSDLGRHEDAIAELESCLALAEERSDRVLRQHALANLGEAMRRQDEPERALRALDEAVDLARALDDEDALAHSLGNLGLVQFQTDDLDAAEASFTEQLELARQLRSPQAEASALGGIGNLQFAAGRFARAAASYRRAAELNADMSPVGEVEDLAGWLESVAAAKRYDDLQEVGQRLVDAAQAWGLEEKAALAFTSTARRLLEAGEREGAADLYSIAVRVHLIRASRAPDFAEAAGESLAYTFGLMAVQVEVVLPDEEREGFYDAVLQSLDRAEEGFGEQLRPFLDDVREAMEDQGVVARLREEESEGD